MIITKANYVFSKKIKIDETEWVVLREPTSAEFQKTSAFKENEAGDKLFEQMRKLLPACITDSSFENEDGSKATGEQVFELLDKSSSKMISIITEWIQSLPFQSKK